MKVSGSRLPTAAESCCNWAWFQAFSRAMILLSSAWSAARTSGDMNNAITAALNRKRMLHVNQEARLKTVIWKDAWFGLRLFAANGETVNAERWGCDRAAEFQIVGNL